MRGAPATTRFARPARTLVLRRSVHSAAQSGSIYQLSFLPCKEARQGCAGAAQRAVQAFVTCPLRSACRMRTRTPASLVRRRPLRMDAAVSLAGLVEQRVVKTLPVPAARPLRGRAHRRARSRRVRSPRDESALASCVAYPAGRADAAVAQGKKKASRVRGFCEGRCEARDERHPALPRSCPPPLLYTHHPAAMSNQQQVRLFTRGCPARLCCRLTSPRRLPPHFRHDSSRLVFTPRRMPLDARRPPLAPQCRPCRTSRLLARPRPSAPSSTRKRAPSSPRRPRARGAQPRFPSLSRPRAR